MRERNWKKVHEFHPSTNDFLFVLLVLHNRHNLSASLLVLGLCRSSISKFMVHLMISLFSFLFLPHSRMTP